MTYASDLAKKLKGMKASGRLAPEIANEALAALAALQCGDECGCTHICRCSVARQVEMSVVDEASGAAQTSEAALRERIISALNKALPNTVSMVELSDAATRILAALAAPCIGCGGARFRIDNATGDQVPCECTSMFAAPAAPSAQSAASKE